MFEFPKVPSIDKYPFGADNAYRSSLGFENTVNFIKELTDEQKIDLTDDYLIIEISEGVYIRTTNSLLCNLLDDLTDPNYIIVEEERFLELDISEWDQLTRRHRGPINWTGEYKFARWRTGFKI